MQRSIQDCDCGFIDSKDPTGSTFNSLLLFDFTKATRADFNHVFIPASYNVTKAASPYVRSYNTANALVSPEGLQLTCSVSTDGKSIPSAGIFTREKSFFYGSYRAEYVLPATPEPGTVTGFFHYKNDTSEIDVEYISAKAPKALQYSVKPQQYLFNGAASKATLALDPLDETSEWSFVWTPEAVVYGKSSTTIKMNVPQAPGRIMLNHWSDGNRYFSQGPPQKDSSVIIRRLQAVYNDATETEAGGEQRMVCEKTKQACLVDDGVVWGEGGDGEGWAVDGVFWSKDS